MGNSDGVLVLLLDQREVESGEVRSGRGLRREEKKGKNEAWGKKRKKKKREKKEGRKKEEKREK